MLPNKNFAEVHTNLGGFQDRVSLLKYSVMSKGEASSKLKGPLNWGEIPVTGNSDQSLLSRYRRGDDDAATELYLKYAHRLRALATAQTSEELKQRVDSEDVVQSVFRTFFRRVSKGQYEVPEGDELWKLLLVIGLNKIRAMAVFHSADKRDISRTTHVESESDLPGDDSKSDEVGLNVLRMTIDELLSQLPVQYRDIVDHRIAGYEVTEIAEMTKRSKRTVERILQTFRQKLSELVEDVQ